MSSRLKNLIWLVVILVAFTVFISVHGDGSIDVNFDDRELVLTAPEQFSCSVKYDEIKALELVDLTDLGSVVSGSENSTYKWGSYKNELWGEYALFINQKIDNGILITTKNDERIVFNLENRDTTTALLDSFRELIDAHKSGSV